MNWYEWILAIFAALFVVYFLSRVQMKAWIKELDNHLGKKLQIFKEDDDEREKEEQL